MKGFLHILIVTSNICVRREMGLKLLQALSKVSKINYKMSRLLIGWLISFLRVREVLWVGLLPAGVLVDSSSFTRRVDHCK